MRITTNLMYRNATQSINDNRVRYLQMQEQLVSQKRINRPSDDPIGAARAMGVNSILGRFNQFQRNVGSARSFVETTELALSHVIDDLTRARELAIDVNGGNAGALDFEAASHEIGRLYENIVQNANAKDGDRYVFAGYRTNAEPFDDAGNYFGGVNQDIAIEVGEGNFVTINKDGNEVFKGPVDVFQVMTDLKTAIETGDTAQISALIPQVEAALNQAIAQRSDIGATTLRLDAAMEDNDELVEAYTKILSETEDVDIAKATSEFAYREQVYQSSLLVASRVMSQSLLDFIR
ncbi:flagellar hook-associated protein FlgL [bacterium]|nr:flagellar hook-associated protein FlgL [bacterium]